MPVHKNGTRIHSKVDCKGRHCVIHNPSDHHMKEWAIIFRETGLAERLCIHGIGHPDPDSMIFMESIRPNGCWGIHGCDGCCDPHHKA